MELLESSASWIIALGKTLLNSLWLGLIFLSLLKALFLMIPHRFAAFRYQAALLTLLLFSALITGLFFHLFSPTPERVLKLSEGTSSLEIFSQLRGDGIHGFIRLYHYISIIYFAGMGIYLALILKGLSRVRSIRREAEFVSRTWHQRFIAFKGKAGINRKVEFLKSEWAETPFLTGIFKPAIIVPAAMLSQLTLSEVESILMHELYHLKRLDQWMNLIQRVVEILFFFNPSIWILSKMLSSEREKRCDDLVLEGYPHPLDYARALYQLSRHQQSPGYLESAATGNGRSELMSRIERILKPNTMNANIREKINTILLFSCTVAVLLIVSGFSSGLSIKPFNEVPVESTPMQSLIPNSYPDTITANEAVEEALAGIDWEEIKKDMEEARRTALEEIDWEEIKKNMEEARRTVLEEIDWEEMKKDMEEARRTVLEEIDWEEIKKNMEEAKRTALEEIDWEEMKKDMEEVRAKIDLMLEDFDFEHDLDVESDTVIEEYQ